MSVLRFLAAMAGASLDPIHILISLVAGLAVSRWWQAALAAPLATLLLWLGLNAVLQDGQSNLRYLAASLIASSLGV